MQLPEAFRRNAIPPMYAWPRLLKRIVLGGAVLLVIVSYLLLAGGVITTVAVLFGQMGG